jgi:hypothetical protein
MHAYTFIFSDKPEHWLKRHGLFWLFWVLFFTLVYGSKPVGAGIPFSDVITVSYSLAFLGAVIYMPCHMLFSYAVIYGLMPRFLFTGRYWTFFAGLALAVLLEASLSHLATVLGVNPVRRYLGIAYPESSFYFGLMAGLRGGLSIGGFAIAIKLMKFFYLKQQANQQLEREKLKAELQLLKAQVHPHFLFNTLNNLYAHTLTRSDQAPEIVLKLSELLRYMLYECNTPRVSLTKELKFLHSYLELEKLRYGERLDIALNIGGDTADKLIAPLLLIPFVENSFKHGASQQLDQAWVSLDLMVKDNTLKFRLINGKTALETPYNPENDRSGRIGLQNVRKRLALIYPGKHELKVLDEGETFAVILTLELEAMPETAAEPPVAELMQV